MLITVFGQAPHTGEIRHLLACILLNDTSISLVPPQDLAVLRIGDSAVINT